MFSLPFFAASVGVAKGRVGLCAADGFVFSSAELWASPNNGREAKYARPSFRLSHKLSILENNSGIYNLVCVLLIIAIFILILVLAFRLYQIQ